MGQRHDTLKALAEAAALKDRVSISPQDILAMRAEAIAAMALPDIRLEHEWEGNPAGTNGRAFDSTYERYALSKKDGEVTVRRVADDQVLRRFVVTSIAGLNRQALFGFSPSNRYLAAIYHESDAAAAFVWDLENSEAHPLFSVNDCSCPWSFAESRRLAAIGTRDQRVRRFDLATGRELEPIAAGIKASAVAVQPQGKVLAVAALEPPVVRLFDLDSGQLLNTLSHAPSHERPGRYESRGIFQGVASLAWHPDGELLATGCYDHKIYIWDWLAGQQRNVLIGHTWEVADVAFSHSGDLLASYGHDKTVRLWDRRTGTLLLTVPQARRWIGFSRDDRTFTAQGEGSRLALCRLDMPPEFRLLEGHHRRLRDVVHAVRFHPLGRLLATTGETDGIRLWDIMTSQQIAHLAPTAYLGVLFERDGAGMLTYHSSQLTRWPLELSSRGGRERLSIGLPHRLLTLENASPWGRATFCGPDQNRIAITDLGRGVNLIELAPRPRVVQSWRTPTAAFLAASPDGRWLATGSFEGPGFQVWDTFRTERARLWYTGDACVGFSPDGRWFVSSTAGGSYTGAELRFWKAGTWEAGPSIRLERTTSSADLAFSDDGRMLAVERTMTELLLLDPGDLRELARLQSREPMILTSLCFSPDGSLLVAGTAGGYLHVWDLRRIRARLAEMHLDWGPLALGPQQEHSTPVPHLDVELQLDRDSQIERARYHLDFRDYRRALADFDEALRHGPEDPEARRELVAILLTGPMALRDLGRASELLRVGIQRDAANVEYRGDLGILLYRQARYSEAVEALEEAIRAHADGIDCARWRIFLALSQHQSGQRGAAQETCRRARADIADAKLSPSAAEEFARLWHEADAILRADAGPEKE
jgi:WD40 repeat protein/Tfp pilus assembly protein PilF